MSAPHLDAPWFLACAAAALALLALARRPAATRAWWSGTLELAREVARAPRAASGARRLPPAAVVCAAAALVAGGLALAAPRAAAGARTWNVRLDASASMFLPWAPPGATPEPGAQTRLRRALDALERELAPRPGERVLWSREVDGRLERAEGRLPPEAWLAPPRAPQPEPDWAALDLPGWLWVSDDAADFEPRDARAYLSGGAQLPGPVAALGRRRLAGSPEALDVQAAPAPAPRLAVEGLQAAGALERLLEAWCSARGVERGPAPAELVLAAAPPLRVQDEPARAAGDGWTWEFRGARGTPRGRPWLEDAQGALVAWTPGRIELAGPGFGEPGGDAAAFAAAWSELLDRAALPPRDVVATSERASAGAPRVLGPPASAAPPAARDSDAGPALYAALATLCAAAALALALRRPGATARP